jgi:hypothetical protein
MPAAGKRAITGLDPLEGSPRNTRRLLRLMLESIPRLSIKPWACLFALMLLCPFLIPPAFAQTVYWTPWVTQTTTTSATVNWRGADNGSGSVEYATSAYYNEHGKFQSAVASGTTGAYQHVALTGLEANTSYVYRARPSDSADQFGNRVFATMPVSGAFTFLVISDTHAQEKRFKYVADAIAKYETDPLFILDGGDYAGWDYEAYWAVYFQYADGMLAKFPIFHTIGNHEYHNLGHADGPPTVADQYHWTFDVATGGALNYSFDCSDVRFVVLNSPDPTHANGDDPQTSLKLASSQAAWLEGKLDNAKSGTFTIHHHPIWDYGRTGINPNLQPWETLYHTYNISANFAGHTHNYQRYSVKNIPYFVVGNAGGKFADISRGAPHAPWYQYGETRQLGYLKVTVDPASNTATAEEIFVAYVEDDDTETATVYDPPIVADTVIFPLSSQLSTLTVTKAGLGSGVVASSDSSIHCGATCRARFKTTGKVVLTPTPDSGSFFAGWTGDCKGSGQCAVTMRPGVNASVGAIFETGCMYSISPDSKALGYGGGKITIKVTAASAGACPAPTVTNKTDWITYTATPFTHNKGSIAVSIPKYDLSAGRAGALTIGGNTFTVSQQGKPCAFSISPASSNLFPAAGGSGTFTVTATPADCAWTATPDKDWITISSGGTGTGTGSVGYNAGANPASTTRTGKIVVTVGSKSKSYTVRQGGV